MSEAKNNKMRRTSAGLRNALFDEIENFRNGVGDPEHANALVKLAGAIINAARLEIEFRKLDPSDRAKIGAMRLGSQPETVPQLEQKKTTEDG